MRVLFDYHELWDVVETGVSALANNVSEAQRVANQKKKDKKTLYLIRQGMNDETFEHIKGATTASEVWRILSTNYKGDDKTKRVCLQTLRRQYELLQMETIETIDVYINKVLALINQMKTNGETHQEQAKVEKILRSLTPRFEHVTAIEEANDISTMTVRLFSSSLRAHEQRMNDNKIEKPIEQALQAQTSIGSSYHKHGSSQSRGWGHGGSYFSKGRGGQNQGGAEQNNTGFNHIPSSNTLGAENVVAEDEEAFIINQMWSVITAINATIMQMNADQNVIIMLPIMLKKTIITYKMKRIYAVLMAGTSNETPNNQTWYLDIGCTNHMCGHKELFADLDDSFRT